PKFTEKKPAASGSSQGVCTYDPACTALSLRHRRDACYKWKHEQGQKITNSNWLPLSKRSDPTKAFADSIVHEQKKIYKIGGPSSVSNYGRCPSGAPVQHHLGGLCPGAQLSRTTRDFQLSSAALPPRLHHAPAKVNISQRQVSVD
ncbi:hypothetical protein BGZ94_006494, partial [Podila epigama]